MNNSPEERYRENLKNGTIIPDDAQKAAVEKLQNLFLQYKSHEKISWVEKIKQHFSPKNEIKGLYLWGGVGRGKTYLMDTFYECLPGHRKMRVHFHQFMRDIHVRLKDLQGYTDPLKMIAKELSGRIDILCFDEFFVSDITDAMLMRELFTELFQQGIILVATSNVEPKDLYKNGLQRELFLPTIALLENYLEIFHVDTERDYRLRELTAAGVYFYPVNEKSQEALRVLFHRMTVGAPVEVGDLLVEGRYIKTVAHSVDAAWFRFEDLCHEPRSQRDYLDIAQNYSVVILENVPIIKDYEDNKITYLIRLIDVFYDNAVKLVVSAEASVEELYPSGRLAFEFLRTKSRMIEMQSEEYLGKPHFL